MVLYAMACLFCAEGQSHLFRIKNKDILFYVVAKI